jgi:hypothetical protein
MPNRGDEVNDILLNGAANSAQKKKREERLFDLVEKTREKLGPYLRLETFPTGSKAHLAVDIILQEAFEGVLRFRK